MLEDRRLFERRLYERRLHDMCEEFLAERAGRCERMRMRLTQEGCMEIRNRFIQPPQCNGCPGVIIAVRQGERRSGEERRTSGDWEAGSRSLEESSP